MKAIIGAFVIGVIVGMAIVKYALPMLNIAI